MFEFASYRSLPLNLFDGDILFVYSDGVTDAENEHDQMFGTERLLNTIQAEAPGGGDALKSGLLSAIGKFTGGTLQTDDITFVIVEKRS
jgi:sigma-B regulation protein RsbU (phosphoserine phosphatase)